MTTSPRGDISSRLPGVSIINDVRTTSTAVNLAGIAGALGVALVLADALTTGQEAQALAIVGLTVVLVAAAINPAAGLLGWLVLAPFGRLFTLDMGSGVPNLGLNRLVVLFLFLILIAQVAIRKRQFTHLIPIEWAGVLFLCSMLLAVPASHRGLTGGLQLLFDTVAVPLLAFYFARTLLNSEQGLQRLAVALAVIGTVLGFIAAREQLTNQAILAPLPYRWAYGQHSVKVTSIFGAPAIMGLTLAMTLPLVFLAAVRAGGLRSRLLWAAALAAIGAGLLLTYVRAGWLSAIAGVSVVILLSRRARYHAFFLVPIVLVVVLLFASGVFDARAIQERFNSEGPIDYRKQALQVGLELAAHSPVLGQGLDNYSDTALAAGWRPVGASGLPSVAAHNLFIYVLVSAGLVGLLPLLALLMLMGWRGLQLWLAAQRSTRARGRSAQMNAVNTPSRPSVSVAPPDPDWLAAALGTWVGYLLFANTIDALNAQLATILFFVIMGATSGAHEAWRARAGGTVAGEGDA